MSGGREAAIRLVVDPWGTIGPELEADARRHPEFADLRNLLGLFYLEMGRHDEAAEEFNAALDRNPGYRAARVHRIVAQRGREGAVSQSEWNDWLAGAAAGTGGTTDPERTLWTAWYAAQAGDGAGMRTILAQLAKEERWRGLAQFHAAVWSSCLGDATAAAGLLRDACASHSLYRRILETRGTAAGRRGLKLEELLPPFALELAPEHRAAAWLPSSQALWDSIGQCSARHGAHDEARLQFEDSFLRHGDESRYWVRIARLALAGGDEEEAVRLLCQAIEIDPTSLEARTSLGFEYQSQGFHDEAVVQFEVAVRLMPRYADLHANLGLLYEAQGRNADAERCYAKALEINPKYFQARMSLAQLFLRTEQHGAALEQLTPLLDQGFESADLLVQQAEACLALDQNNEAVAALEKAQALNPSFPRTYFVLGTAYRKLGLKRKAQEAWRHHLDCTRRWQEGQPLRPEEGSSPHERS